MEKSPGFYYHESRDHARAGWYNYNDNPAIAGAIIVSLKRSGDLFRHRYAVKNIMEATPLIDAWVQVGALPKDLECLPSSDGTSW